MRLSSGLLLVAIVVAPTALYGGESASAASDAPTGARIECADTAASPPPFASPAPGDETSASANGPLQQQPYPPPTARACCTRHGSCPLPQPQPVGSPCSCYTPYAPPIRGVACIL